MKEPNKFHNYETEKITRKASAYNCKFSATSLALRVIFVHRKRPPIHASCMMISGGRTEQHVVIGFGELAAVD